MQLKHVEDTIQRNFAYHANDSVIGESTNTVR
jgi:hypothetical protein